MNVEVNKNGRRLLPLGALGLGLGLIGQANAQDSAPTIPDNYRNASEIDALNSYEVLDDGSVRVFLDNGSSFVVPSGQYVISGEALWIEEAVLAGVDLGGGLGLLPMIALPVAGAAVLVGTFAGGGGEEPQNNAPIISSGSAFSVNENQTAAFTATATDAEGSTITYSISGGADAARFAIDANTGVVTFIAAPDFEAPADADANNIYEVRVTASDGVDSVSRTVNITINNLPDTGQSPVITSGAAPAPFENQTTAFTVTATDADSASLTYAITGGADAALFAINAATGVVTFLAPPDFEAPGDANGDNAYQIQVTVSDGVNQTTQAVTVTVRDAADSPVAPAITSAATATVSENQTGAYTVTATDANGDTITYSITGGADAALFTINASTGVVTFNAAPDFELPADADGNNVYDIVVTASDGSLTDNQAVAITVNDLNDSAPSIFGVQIFGATANSDSGAAVSVGDIDGDGVNDIIIGAPAETDALQAGAVYVVSGAEVIADADGRIDLESNLPSVRVVIQGGAAGDQAGWSVGSIGDIDGDGKAEVLIGAPRGADNAAPGQAYLVTSTAIAAAAAGGGVINLATLGAGGVRFTTAGGGDELGYNVGSAGDVDNDGIEDLLVTARENDATGSNRGAAYVVFGTTIASELASDGVLDVSTMTASQGVRITGGFANGDRFGSAAWAIGDINNDGFDDIAIGGPQADQNALSNSGEVAIVYGGRINAEKTGAGSINLGLTTSFAPGTDGVRINGGVVDGQLGDLGGVAGGGDSNGDGVGDILVAARRANANLGEAVLIWGDAATSEADGIIDLSSLTPAQGIRFTGLDAGDQLGRTVSFVGDIDGDGLDEIVIGAPPAAGQTNANGFTGEGYLIWGSTLAAERTGDGVINLATLNGTDGVVLYGRAGGSQFSFGISAAGDLDGDGLGDLVISARNINTRAGETYVIAGDVLAQEKSGGDGVILIGSITPRGVAGSTPAFTSPASATVSENTTAAYSAVATDADPGDTITYSITGGADSALFSINATSGAVTFNTAPDFEAPADAGADNIYDIVVTASDGVNASSLAVAITVTDVVDTNAAPVFTSGAAASVGENTTAAYTAVATDANSDPVTYSITGGADAALFSINATSGAVTFNAAPDFEAPADAGGNNVYDIVVTATDGATPTNLAVAITVTNVNDNSPVITSANAASVSENQTSALTLAATDADAGATLSYAIVGGVDASLFSINASTGVLTFNAAPDFEAPADFGANNVYNVDVAASDGLNVTSQSVAITVTNVNELGAPPIFTSPTSAAVDENQTSAYTATATDLDPADTVTFSITGGADAALFSINASSGVVTFNTAPDFEAPGDAGGNNVYNIEITATDGLNNTLQAVAITVNDVAEGPSSFIFRLNGTAVGQDSGYALSAGDVDGDGVNDILIGAPFESSPTTNAGGAFLVLGSTLNADLDGDIDLATQAIRFDGVQANDFTGFDVAIVGDMNADGNADVLIGAPALGSTTRTGSAYLIYSDAIIADADGAINLGDVGGATAGVAFNGANNTDQWGIAVGSLGDIDGDGRPELFVGGDRDGSGGTNTGKTVIIWSSTVTALGSGTIALESLGVNGVAIYGQDNGDRSATSVSAIGDLDGDGLNEIAIGSTSSENGALASSTNLGSVTIVYSTRLLAEKTGNGIIDVGSSDYTLLTDGVQIYGAAASDVLAGQKRVIGAGDVNGDGEADILVASHQNDDGGANSGAAYVVFGEAAIADLDGEITLSTLTSAQGVKIIAANAGDQAGWSIASLGDLDGDGLDDIAVGVRFGDTTGQGEVVVIWGSTIAAEQDTGDGVIDLGNIDGGADNAGASAAEDVTLDLDGALAVILGGSTSSQTGFSVASAGDLDNDGVNDLLIGAIRADGTAGETFVVSGALIVAEKGAAEDGLISLDTASPDPFGAISPSPTPLFAGAKFDSTFTLGVDYAPEVLAENTAFKTAWVDGWQA